MNLEKTQNQSDQTSGCPGMGWGRGRGRDAKGHRGLFRGRERDVVVAT